MIDLKFIQFSFRLMPQRGWNVPRKYYSKSYKEIRKEKFRPVKQALSQFDDFYGSVFQDQWPSIRIALLSPAKKGVVINNFGDVDRVSKELRNIGAHRIREVWTAQAMTSKENSSDDKSDASSGIYQFEGRLEDIIQRKQLEDAEEIFPESLESLATLTKSSTQQSSQVKFEDESDDARTSEDPTKDQPLSQTLKDAEYDTSRIIASGPAGYALSASLYDFVPATKLKGMDDFIPESTHYSYYKDSSEAPVEYEIEKHVHFPDALEAYAFERGNCDSFNVSRKGSTNVLDYHIFSLGYLAPVLALGLEQGEVVLDLTCSSVDIPILIAQTLIPGMLVLNCGEGSRAKYMLRFLNNYIWDICDDNHNIEVTDFTPLAMEDEGKFDKVIVSAPNTQDRKSLLEDENNMFGPAFIRERIKLPETQTEYLKKALKLVKEGGSVIYYTETLSPIQNEAVVQRALDDLWINFNLKFIIKDLTEALEPIQPFMKIVKQGKYGHLVLPFLPNNCGPIYFSKFVKCRSDVDQNKEPN